MTCKNNLHVSLLAITIAGCMALFSPTMVEALPYDLYIYPTPLDGSKGGITAPVSVWSMADYLANLPYTVNAPLVVITAQPTNGYVFSSWERVAGDANVMIMDTNAASTIVSYAGNNPVFITAKFKLWKLRVVVDGNGSVDQSPTPHPIDLGYTNGQVVTLTAIPGTEQAFIRWGGAVSDIYANPATVTMTNDTTITAYFRVAEPDQDRDNLPDWWEVQYGLNPRDPTGVNGSDGDPDNDGLSNYQEYWLSYIVLSNQSVRFFANPIHADSDGDGMDDGYEFYHIGITTNLCGTNAMAVVTPTGIYGRNGNPDQDFKWNTLTGYKTDVGLVNYEEYVGPDMMVPGTWTNPITVPGVLLPVYAFVPNPDDTGDQSFSDTIDSEIIGGDISGDGFDDGFEWSWDVWQGVHGGELVGDPLGHRIPDRFGSPANPLSVTVGDWNADGFLDLAVANSGHDEVTTLYGRGDGTFNAVSNAYAVQDYPRMIASGDLDGDGQADDLAVVNGGGNSISVLLGTGGIHGPATHYSVGNNPSCLVIDNFTGSAANDIAVANEGSDNVMILAGPGFGVVQTIPVGTAPSSIAAGPIFGAATNPAALLDLVVANRGSDSVSVLRNVGGVFVVFGTVTVGSAPSSVELRDFDNDGTNDLVVSCYNSSEVRGYRGNGDGTFGPQTVTFLGTGRGPRNIAAGHLDRYVPPAGNTNLDVAVANELANTVSILLGSGSGVAFSLFTSIDVPNFPCWVEIADFNNDGTNDLVVVQRDSDTVRILFGYGDGRFADSGVYDVASRIVDRRFNPAGIHPNPPDFGRPDYDLCYDVNTGFVGDWYSDDLEYKAWSITNSINISTNGLMRREFPDRPRCTNPFLWDTDGDRMPDGWELAFNYDPWARKTYQLGLGNDDSEDNPDGDWMAQSGTNKHWYVCRYVPGVYEPYGYTGTYFDPHTGWYYLEPVPGGWPGVGANTVRFINYEELIGPRGIPALVPYDPEDNATHPRNYDTDRDGMWDGWEWYVYINGNDPADGRRISPRNSLDGVWDYDGDGLSNLEEFMSYATSTNNKAFITPLTNWLNKFYPTDPWTTDTDGDQISDGGERDSFNYLSGVTQLLTMVCYRGGGLNPTTVDTDNDYLPDYWEASFPGGGVDTNFNPVGGGMDGTFGDAFEDYDEDRLLNYQEYMVGCTYHWQWSYNQDCAGGWWPGGGWGSYAQWDFFDVETSRSSIYPWGDNMVGTGAREPKWWDEAFWAKPPELGCPGVPYRFMTAATPPRRGFCLPIPLMGAMELFSTSDPSSVDTDEDGMDDYWEIYHMHDPIWGGRDLVFEKLAGARLPPIVPSGGPDIWNYPWINGGTFTDSDCDGLPHIFESIQPNTPQPYYYHTDTSPYWLSDISDFFSWANLYYCVHPPMSCGNYWYWNERVMNCAAMSPNYLYSFEINEGFDTDNDGYADRAELVDTRASPGSTDPIDSEDPIRHRAFYLDGVDSALRTYNPIGHGYTQFRTFTVECWVKPQAPQMGRPQIFVERTSFVPRGNPMGYLGGIRVNFRLGCDASGRAFIGYHGAGYDPIFEEAKVPPDQVFVSNVWYHVAGVYDGYGPTRTNGSFKGELRLYINGKLAAMKPTSEIPWNGWYDGNPGNPTIPQPVAITPMPIVIGAQDNNPSGWVDGWSIVKNWNLICACRGPVYAGPVCGAPNLPSLGNYFRGWIDEVRIWDGPRSQTDIQVNFRRRFTRADVIQANQNSTTTTAGTPVLLVYAFGFDDARDPVVDGIVPAGFDLLPLGPNPSSYPGVEWWYTLPSGLRSSVYTDYRYVPWVENLASHLPWNPPLDSIVPWDTSDNFYPNTMNPYVWDYRAGVTYDEEMNPRYQTWMIAGTGTATNMPIYGDVLPLGNARADATVKLWEEDGKYKPFDFDGDGLPDDWETTYGLDPRDPTGVNGPDGDPDADGLSNFYEYLTGNKPMSGDSDGDGLSDALEDYDGDGLTNLAELQLGTLPHRKDTDDDGVTDWEEVTGSVDWSYDPGRPPTSRRPTRQSDPLDPLDPIVQRCAYLGTNGNARVIVPPHNKFMTTDWTVELWVRPSAGSDGGVLVSRYVQGVIPGEWGINYELGLTTNNALPGTLRLYTSFRTKDGVEYRVDGLGPTERTAGLATNAVPYDQWTHVVGTFAVASNTMSIYVNAKLVSYRMDASGVPPTVLGYFDEHWGDEVTIGASRSTGPVVNGYEGYLDEVRIWRVCRTAKEIADLYNGIGTSISRNMETAGPRYEQLPPEEKRRVDQILALARTLAVRDGNQYNVAYNPALTRPLSQLCGRLTNPALAPKTNPAYLRRVPVVTVPARFDWREQNGVTAVKDQGNCGCCWAHATVAALEGAIKISTHQDVDLSEQYLVSCNLDGWGCGGGLTAHKYHVSTPAADGKFGAVFETDCPYAAADLPCQGPYSRPYVGQSWAFVGNGDYDIPPDEAIKRAIYKYGPISAAVYAGPAFQAYAGGIFNTDESAQSGGFANHAITLVGWDDAGRYWILKNSWGEGWGENGYMRIAYGISLIGQGAAYIQFGGVGGAGGIAGEFRFDDGGLTAQDFSIRADWMEDWRHAAIMDGAVFATNTVPPLDKDTDGDGMPDWWEVAYGLDPTDPTGDNGAYGDPDKDELDNLYEYLAGTDPRLIDTDGDGFSDYDSMSESARASGVGRTFGEIYDDGDRIPDLWEVQYMGICPETGNRGLDPAYYDAHLDPDEDGWSNYTEFMAGTDPLTGTNYPMPIITVHARYNGLLAPDINALIAAGGVVHLDIYKVRSMDGYPIGTLDMVTNVLSTNMLTTGRLVEGPLYIFGYIDRDGDGQWNPDTEPAGLVEPFPVYIGWGDVNNVEIALTDKLDGYPRFRWEPPTNVIDGYELRMMQGTTELFRRFIRGSFRSYFHEGDYLYQGRYGLGAGTYSANIFYKDNVYGLVYTNYLTTVIIIVDPITPSAPQFVTADDFVYEYAKNDLIWKGSSGATAYAMGIYNSSGQLLLSVTNRMPYRDPNGNYRTVLPFYARDNYAPGGIWTNGRYTVTLRAFNPSATSAISQRNVQLLLKDPVAGGKSKIEGDVYYFGKVQRGYLAHMPGYTTNLVIIIQTFMSPGFSGEPDAQVQLTTFASTNNYGYKGSYKLLGLHNGTHYVRAFIDLNGNRVLDNFEPYGFYQRYTNAFAYESAPVDLTGGGNVAKSGIRIVIRDRDTDDDGLPDGWEWMYYGHLNYGADTLGVNGLTLLLNYEASPMDLDPTKTDFDGDGLSDFFEVTYSDWIRGLPPNPKHYNPYHPVHNPDGTDLEATRADTDCDGLSDKYEVDNGLNPLDPRGDADGDGIPDAQEVLLTKTSPRNASDVLMIRTSQDIPFTFTWNGKSGVTYKVQYCDNLVTGTWQDAPDGIRTGTGVLSYTDNNLPVKGIRFYRVVVVQP